MLSRLFGRYSLVVLSEQLLLLQALDLKKPMLRLRLNRTLSLSLHAVLSSYILGSGREETTFLIASCKSIFRMPSRRARQDKSGFVSTACVKIFVHLQACLSLAWPQQPNISSRIALCVNSKLACRSSRKAVIAANRHGCINESFCSCVIRNYSLSIYG